MVYRHGSITASSVLEPPTLSEAIDKGACLMFTCGWDRTGHLVICPNPSNELLFSGVTFDEFLHSVCCSDEAACIAVLFRDSKILACLYRLKRILFATEQ